MIKKHRVNGSFGNPAFPAWEIETAAGKILLRRNHALVNTGPRQCQGWDVWIDGRFAGALGSRTLQGLASLNRKELLKVVLPTCCGRHRGFQEARSTRVSIRIWMRCWPDDERRTDSQMTTLRFFCRRRRSKSTKALSQPARPTTSVIAQTTPQTARMIRAALHLLPATVGENKYPRFAPTSALLSGNCFRATSLRAGLALTDWLRAKSALNFAGKEGGGV